MTSNGSKVANAISAGFFPVPTGGNDWLGESVLAIGEDVDVKEPASCQHTSLGL